MTTTPFGGNGGYVQSLDFEAVSLDAGGVLVMPDHGLLSHALRRHGVPHDRGRFTDGHYRAMAEQDRTGSDPETFGDYTRGFLEAVGVPADHLEAGAVALSEMLVSPLWHQRIPGAMDAVRLLQSLGLRLAVTSNADGTVEEMLRRHEVLQVGPGPGVEVEVVTDSGVVGFHKPDPRVFQATADGLGLPPEAICHIGDSGSFDADGARSFGMVAVHVDPLGLCDRDHHHEVSLAAFAEGLAARHAHELSDLQTEGPSRPGYLTDTELGHGPNGPVERQGQEAPS